MDWPIYTYFIYDELQVYLSWTDQFLYILSMIDLGLGSVR